ncbi:unnamed protein product [Calypogeia fissa]
MGACWGEAVEVTKKNLKKKDLKKKKMNSVKSRTKKSTFFCHRRRAVADEGTLGACRSDLWGGKKKKKKSKWVRLKTKVSEGLCCGSSGAGDVQNYNFTCYLIYIDNINMPFGG